MNVLNDCFLLSAYFGLCWYIVFRLTPKLLNDYLLELNPIAGRSARDTTLKIWFFLIVLAGGYTYFQFKNFSTAVVFMLMLPFLFSLSYIDFKTCYLPDRLQTVCAVLAASHFTIAIVQTTAPGQLIVSRLFSLFVPLCVWVVGVVYEKLRKVEGLGFGDIKLLGWMALYLDTELDILGVLLIGIAIALAINIPRVLLRKIDSQTPFAFGPYLIAGFLAVAFLKGTIWLEISPTIDP